MRSATPADLRGLCARCWQRAQLCLCAEIPRVVARTRILILRHAKESWRTSNTARLASLAIEGVEVLEIGTLPEGTGSPADFAAERARVEAALAAFLGDGSDTQLLFPSNREPRGPDRAPPRRLIVPDGSWRQARRIIQRLPGLAELPRLSLAALPPEMSAQPRLRRPPLAEGMSTLEAIARALALLEGEDLARPLDALYALHVERQLTVRRRNER